MIPILFTAAFEICYFLIFQKFLTISNLLFNFHQFNSSFVLQYSKMITVIDNSWAYVLQNDLNVSNDTIEIDAIGAIPNHDNLILKGAIGTILILNFGCAVLP